jgi:hypothetical protein
MEKKYVKVEFIGYSGKQYAFWTDLELQAGDLVVVDSTMGYGVAVVMENIEFSDKANRWVVQKVDLEAHVKRIERAEQMKLLKQKMEARQKELLEIAQFESLAKEDETMSKLVEEFKTLSAQ